MSKEEFDAMQAGTICFEAMHVWKDNGQCEIVFLNGEYTTFSYI